MPADLPNVRIEQIWLALLIPSIGIYHRNHAELRRPLFVDWAFLALGATTLFTLAAAPFVVDDVSRSPRDVFELARVAEYWLAFRFAFAAWGGRPAITPIVLLIAVVAGVSGLLAIGQYLDAGRLNDLVTDTWATPHSLDSAIRNGRAVGFVGNPNHFGIFSGLLLGFLLAYQTVSVGRGTDKRMLVMVAVAAGLATAGILLSQSRTATAATIGALGLGFALSLLVNRGRTSFASYAAPIVTLLVAGSLTIGFAETFPPEFGSLRARFDVRSFSDDSSFSLRITRWRTLLGSVFSDPPSICTGEPLDSFMSADREPVVAGTTTDSEVIARDTQRRADVRALAGATVDYFCDNDEWPAGNTEALLVPDFIDPLPLDPLTGEPYELYVISGGFITSASLEDERSPTGAAFALGTMPNYVQNHGFENGDETPKDWRTSGAADGRAETLLTVQEDSRFGEKSVLANIGGGSGFYQQVVQDFALGLEYTVNVWAKAQTESETVQIYIIGNTADGRALDPLARSEPIQLTTEDWSASSLSFVTPTSSRIVVMSVLIRSIDEADSVDALFDAITLTPGPFPPSYPWVREASPADRTPLPGFADSPLIGVGPLKGIELGALDNEYGLFLDRYGISGLAAYLTVFGSALWTAVTASRARPLATAILGLGLVIGTVGFMVFSIAAGSYYNFQLMAIFWPLVGIAAAMVVTGSSGDGGVSASHQRGPGPSS